ncbi:MAG: FHA domain-containing protein [Bradymonadaceae bacterium]
MATFRFEYNEDGETREFTFDDANVTVGREQSSDFVLDHPTVSRQHAMVVNDGGGNFRLVVLSQGGLTAVDGQKVQNETELYDGSQLHFGELSFTFRADSAPSKPAGGGATGARGAATGAGGAAAQGAAAGAQPEGGGAGQQAAPGGAPGGGAEAGGGEAPGEEDPRKAAGVESWDEIASEADDATGMHDSDSLANPAVDSGSRKDEQTNPVLVAVAGVMIVGLLALTFFSGGGGGKGKAEEKGLQGKPYDLTLKVECLGPSDCLKSAKNAYAVGVENLEQRTVEIRNLYNGYKKLYEAKQYLKKYRKKSGKKNAQKQLPKLEKKLKGAKAALEKKFQKFRVKFHNNKRNKRYKGMARALQRIKDYFGKESRAYRWATKKEREMRDRGTYPKFF